MVWNTGPIPTHEPSPTSQLNNTHTSCPFHHNKNLSPFVYPNDNCDANNFGTHNKCFFTYLKNMLTISTLPPVARVRKCSRCSKRIPRRVEGSWAWVTASAHCFRDWIMPCSRHMRISIVLSWGNLFTRTFWIVLSCSRCSFSWMMFSFSNSSERLFKQRRHRSSYRYRLEGR